MQCVVHNATRGTVLADRVAVAASPLARLRGLIGTRGLRPGAGLLLRPCRRVHSFFMRYALDLVFIDADDRVVAALADFGPGRVSPRVGAAAAVLELPSGTLAAAPAVPGDRLKIRPRSADLHAR